MGCGVQKGDKPPKVDKAKLVVKEESDDEPKVEETVKKNKSKLKPESPKVPVEDEIQQCVIKNLYLRGDQKDIYQVTIQNTIGVKTPFTTLKVTVDGRQYYTTVLSYNKDDVKFLLKKSVGKLRESYKVTIEKIDHERPIMFPDSGNLIIIAGEALALGIAMKDIYELKDTNNKFIVVYHDKESMIYQSNFNEKVKNYTMLQMNMDTDDLKIKTRESVERLQDLVQLYTMQNPEGNLIVFGSVWLIKLIQQMTENRKFNYGYQFLKGQSIDKHAVVGRISRLWMKNEEWEDDKEDQMKVM